MPRLSIVIPALGTIDSLEEGLVSVLQHRPADTEVLVVLNRPYADPYHLQDEVCFLDARRYAGFASSANLGLSHATGEVVHLLASGVQVTEGWTDEPLARFDDPRVAAVAPLVLDARDRLTVVAAGVGYDVGGEPIRQSAAHRPAGGPGEPCRGWGPSSTAAFYRTSVLEALGGFDDGVGDALADVDLALTLDAMGLMAHLERQSIVYFQGTIPGPTGGFRQARFAERLFLRHAQRAGWARSLARHAAAVAGEFVRTAPRPAAATQLAGRLAAWAEWLALRRQRHRFSQLRDRLAAGLADRRPGLRFDVAHRIEKKADNLPHGDPVALRPR